MENAGGRLQSNLSNLGTVLPPQVYRNHELIITAVGGLSRRSPLRPSPSSLSQLPVLLRVLLRLLAPRATSPPTAGASRSLTHYTEETMPSEISFVAGDAFHTAVKGADKLFIVAPASCIKDGTAFAAMRASNDPLAATLLPFAEALAAKAGSGSATGSATSMPVIGTSKDIALIPLQDSPSSRYYSETQSMAITGGLSSAGITGTAKAAVLIVL
jgi:hypothetical protein